jgi:putative ABC transport system ATP-binding protein
MSAFPTPESTAPPAPPIIRLRQVRKSYQIAGAEVAVLNGLDLEVTPGDAVLIRGVSGSGKTTLLNLLGGIDRATGGELRVCGDDLEDLDKAGLTAFRRRRVGFVFQFHNLLPTLTVRENVALGLEAARIAEPEATARAMRYIDYVGLAARVDAFPQEMSGGEQQRVAIARALAKEPPLLLADEPTGNLDEATSVSILELLGGLRRSLGTTLILASHDPAAARVGGRALLLQHGLLRSASKAGVEP